MASSYPGSLDSFDSIASDKKTSDTVGGRTHRDMHNDLGDAIEAVQAELGTNPSASESTVAARLTAIEADVVAHDSLRGYGPTDTGANRAWNTLPGTIATGNVGTTVFASGNIYYLPFTVEHPDGITLTDLQIEVTSAASASNTLRLVVANASASFEPTSLATGGDIGTVAIDANAVVTKSSIGLSLPRGRYLLGLYPSANVTLRRITQVETSGAWMATGGWGTSPFIVTASRNTGAPTGVPNINSLGAGNVAGLYSPILAKWSIN